jgi:hypothetical protein
MMNYIKLALLIGCTVVPRISYAETPGEIRTHVVGRVITPEGKPIAGATVWWQGPTPSGVNSPAGSPGTTDWDGKFRIPVLVKSLAVSRRHARSSATQEIVSTVLKSSMRPVEMRPLKRFPRRSPLLKIDANRPRFVFNPSRIR